MSRPEFIRVAGQCVKHNDLAWRYGDGSIECVWCLVVERGSTGCEWAPMPDEWREGGQRAIDKAAADG